MAMILNVATDRTVTPPTAISMIQRISAAALVDTFSAKLALVPETHRVVPVDATAPQVKAALGDKFQPEDEVYCRLDYTKMVQAAPQLGDPLYEQSAD
jgi:hypothetical protein